MIDRPSHSVPDIARTIAELVAQIVRSVVQLVLQVLMLVLAILRSAGGLVVGVFRAIF